MTGQGGYTIKFIFARLPELYTGFLEENSSPNSAIQLYRGVYWISNSYFAPIPFLIYIFSPTEIYYNEGVLPQAKNYETFFSNFVYFKSIGDKILFTNMGKIAPLFFIPFQSFFSPNLLFGHIFAPPREGGGGSNRKIYTRPLQL